MEIGKIDFSELDQFITNLIGNKFNIEDITGCLSVPLSRTDLRKISEYLRTERAYNTIELNAFNQRLNIRWGKVFNMLEDVIDFSYYSINEGQKFVNIKNPKNYLLIQLHAKQLLLAQEILVLLKNGFGEGANARWRSLYENVVITSFICKNKKDVAIRYLEHKNILNYKEVLKYKESYRKLKHKGYDRDNLIKLETIQNDLIKKYGNSFNREYGWIPDKLSKDKTFTSIEKLVDMSHFRPYFSLSSRSIHSLAKSFENLGNNNSDLLLIGPSNSGLSDPIQNTSIFLMKGASFILFDFMKQPRKNIQARLIILHLIKILMGLEKGIGKECIKIQDLIDSSEQELKQSS